MSTAGSHAFSEREKGVLELIADRGAFTCTGGCEQRQSGQLHCMNLAQEIGTTNRKVWQTVTGLVALGILQRERDEEARCWRFTLTEEGRRIMAAGRPAAN